MPGKTKIEWATDSWNPVRGCSIVSEGCRNCYAMRQAHRFSGPGKAYEGLTRLTPSGPVWTGKVRLITELLDLPLRWKRPRRIFVNSMSDLFHESLTEGNIRAVFTTMAAAQHHTFQVLTKRPQRMRDMLMGWEAAGLTLREGHGVRLPNVWLGISIENQKTADERIPFLMQTPAAIRWVSAEPLIGPTTFRPLASWAYRNLSKYYSEDGFDPTGSQPEQDRMPYFPRIDWLVVGGESGPGARPMHPDWARALRDEANRVGCAFHFKQWGAWAEVDEPPERTPWICLDLGGKVHDPKKTAAIDAADMARMGRIGKKASGRELDGRTWDECPSDGRPSTGTASGPAASSGGSA